MVIDVLCHGVTLRYKISEIVMFGKLILGVSRKS